jgi:hypothetical protein
MPPFPGSPELRQMLVVSTRNGVPPVPGDDSPLTVEDAPTAKEQNGAAAQAEAVPLVPRRSHHKKPA